MSRFCSRLIPALAVACCLVGPAHAGQGHYATSDSKSDKRSEIYRDGQRALEREDWGEASHLFGKLASGSTSETDAALYWKAYADWKQMKKQDALEGLRRLTSGYPQSAWVDDARALEQEIRGGTKATKASNDNDEELKLYALDGLMQMEPERAVPVLEKLLAGNASYRVKERALFVLSQSDSPRAREILMRTVRTGQPIELRCAAIKTLGTGGLNDDLRALAPLARDRQTPMEVREALLEAYLIADMPQELLSIAKSDAEPDIRAKAIEELGAMDAGPALRQLWATEKDPELKVKLLQGFGVSGDVESLAKAARDSDPEIRKKAIEGLGIAEGEAARKTLRQLYGEYSNPEERRKVLEAFMVQGDAKTLLELFRTEKDPAMKKAILQQLSVMDDPDATRAILEVLGE